MRVSVGEGERRCGGGCSPARAPPPPRTNPHREDVSVAISVVHATSVVDKIPARDFAAGSDCQAVSKKEARVNTFE
jgi:hypothetical protein